MRTLLLLAMVVAFGLQQADGHLLQFRKMINMATGKNALTSYGFYGCYCGWGGRGSPKDATDWCCFRHDCCYAQLDREGCSPLILKYHVYYRGNTITCENQDSCRKRLCECDRAAALCFARNMGSYNIKFRFYCNWFCSGGAPMCPV